MRRLRTQFKIAAWEQRERYQMNYEEDYLIKFYEREREIQTTTDMIEEETFLHNFYQTELSLEQEFETQTNNDMIEEEKYLKNIYEELEIMEASERKRIFRNALRLKILREAKRRISCKKAWKMYIWSLFILKAKEILKERKKAYMEKLARKASMRNALFIEAKRLKHLLYLEKLRKKYKKRRIITDIMTEAKLRIALQNEAAFRKIERNRQRKEMKNMGKAEKESYFFELYMRELKKEEDRKASKLARKAERMKQREERRKLKLQKGKEEEEDIQQEGKLNKKKNALSKNKGSDSDSDSEEDPDDYLKNVDVIYTKKEARSKIASMDLGLGYFSDSSEITESDEDATNFFKSD